MFSSPVFERMLFELNYVVSINFFNLFEQVERYIRILLRLLLLERRGVVGVGWWWWSGGGGGGVI